MTKQIDDILNQDAEQRFHYLVKEVIANNNVWLLTDEHGCMMLNTEEEDCIPVWPSESYALAWATGDWKNCKAEPVSLNKWYSRWSMGLEDDGLALVIFPNKNNQGLVLYPEEFEIALQKETKKQNRK